MHNTSIAIFTDDVVSNLGVIGNIKTFFKQQGFEDFIIFSDNISHHTKEHSVLTSFYIVAFYGPIVFLNVDDYIQLKDIINGKPMVFLSGNNYSFDRSTIKGCDILINNESQQLQWIKKHELQQTF